MPELDSIIIQEKEKISLHFKTRLKRISSYYQKKINDNSVSFEKAAKKICKEHESVYNLLIKDYDKKFSKSVIQRASFASLRKKIIFEICEYFGYEVSEIITSRRREERGKTDCIQLIYYFLYLHKIGTLKEIGQELNRKASTVCVGIGSVENFIKVDKTFKRHFNNLSEIIEDVIEEVNKI
jgi:chromosomal replication initiation ATPase DnaA